MRVMVKNLKGYYDPNAPKFRYERDIFNFTRKTSRVRKGDELSLFEESKPSTSKREGSRYPWTKPMPGWKRVFVGRGRWIQKGRHKRTTKPSYAAQGVKPPRRKFMKYPRTYGYGQ